MGSNQQQVYPSNPHYYAPYTGWSCRTCGAWVPNGTTHYCGNHTWAPTQTGVTTYGLGEVMARLERMDNTLNALLLALRNLGGESDG